MADGRISRRKFLTGAGALAGGVAAAGVLRGLDAEPVFAGRNLRPVAQIDNPLEYYPDRAWEDVYRNQYSYDRSFTYVCSPNDTHACRIQAWA